MRHDTIKAGGILLCAGLFLAANAKDGDQRVRGTWSLNNWTSGDSLHLKLKHHNATTTWKWGVHQPISDLHGLTREQLHSAHAPVKFTLERDAGSFAFEGTVMLGIGSGEFGFVPDPSFASKLSVLGYDAIGEGELFTMALRDISIAYAGEVKRSGVKNVAVHDLVRLRDHGVSLDFIRELTMIGYANLSADDVVRLRDHGVDAAFIRTLKSAGFPDLAASEIIRLRDHGVDSQYVARIQSAGFTELTVEQIVKLHDHGVD